MNITDSDSSDPPSLTTDDSESPAGAPTPQAPNASEIPHNPHPVPSQRGINGDRPFQPPTIVSHSLENAQGGLQPRNLMIGVGYYSPPPTQMRAIPPNGPPGAQQTLQQQHHALLARPPSNPASPSVQQGQLLAHRQVSGVSGTASTATTPETLAAELNQIPPLTLAKLKRKLGMAGKDLATMTPEEKVRARPSQRIPAPVTSVRMHRCDLCSCSVEGPRNRVLVPAPRYLASNKRCVCQYPGHSPRDY